MKTISLAKVASQTISARLDGRRYVITIKSIGNNVMAASIVRDGVTIITNSRIVTGSLIMPYRSMEDQSGNFAIVVDDGNSLIDYLQFGDTQTLVYYSNAELVAARG